MILTVITQKQEGKEEVNLLDVAVLLQKLSVDLEEKWLVVELLVNH